MDSVAESSLPTIYPSQLMQWPLIAGLEHGASLLKPRVKTTACLCLTQQAGKYQYIYSVHVIAYSFTIIICMRVFPCICYTFRSLKRGVSLLASSSRAQIHVYHPEKWTKQSIFVLELLRLSRGFHSQSHC